MTRVLIVDDDRDTREAMRFLLEDAGYDVVEAPDGNSALEMLHSSSHQLVVLLDWMMPGVGGADVLNAVAGDDTISKRHAYILVTASPTYVSGTVVELTGALSVPVVPKPFDVEVLLEAVAAAAQRLPAPGA